jgi:membrane protein implicated in regulation of membrane protease activity
MPSSTNWILVILGAVMILAEVLLGAISGFDFLLLGSAILLGGVLGLVTGSTVLGVAAAGVLSLLYVAVGRRHIKARLGRHDIPTNTDALLGKTMRVVEAIGPGHAGRVKYEGDEWRAEADSPGLAPLEPGRNVRVVRIDGVTVYVVPTEPVGSSGGART